MMMSKAKVFINDHQTYELKYYITLSKEQQLVTENIESDKKNDNHIIISIIISYNINIK